MQVFNNTWLSFGVHTFPTSNRFLFASAGPVSGSWIARKECDEWLSGERSEQGGRARPGTREGGTFMVWHLARFKEKAPSGRPEWQPSRRWKALPSCLSLSRWSCRCHKGGAVQWPPCPHPSHRQGRQLKDARREGADSRLPP
ncbi:uncharacterized protein LOC143820064 isoform X3 [Paroedura picta]|uniref:uncharacterized protein LOC143820064 isoform X3 n=1 Tax=Paroedura picta TaxID=143630 RepID=UPI004056853C